LNPLGAFRLLLFYIFLIYFYFVFVALEMRLPPFTNIVYVGLAGSVVGGFVGMYFAEQFMREARVR
jgi:hypothetical protein